MDEARDYALGRFCSERYLVIQLGTGEASQRREASARVDHFSSPL